MFGLKFEIDGRVQPLNWGLIGGGEGSQIGSAHRMAARLDGRFQLAAGAFDIDPAGSRKFGQENGVATDRSYGHWQDMLVAESEKPKDAADRLHLISVATPNSTHYEITKAFLQAGFHVLCEKPMTMSVEEAEDIVKTADETGMICAVNYGYTGYPMVREMKAMVESGKLGDIRLVKAEFAHGFHADAADADNPRIRWRYDPSQIGPSAQFADCGIHALHMACFITGQKVEKLSADFVSTIASRQLEDDAMVNFRMSGGAAGRLWTSSIAVGRMHGFNMQIFGEKGGVRWSQEQPNQLYFTPTGGGTQIVERGAEGTSLQSQRASRVTIGHTEGMPLAFANIYQDLAECITASIYEKAPDDTALDFPSCKEGLESMKAIAAAVSSAKADGAWKTL